MPQSVTNAGTVGGGLVQGPTPKRKLQMNNIKFNPQQAFPPVAGSSPINNDSGYSA